ncbi:MAG: hypothetical protein V1835_00350 [Candidatus Micrarchaeota archaeon]
MAVTEILDFEMLDDVLILVGILVYFLTEDMPVSLVLIAMGILVMAAKGEIGVSVPKKTRKSADDDGMDEQFDEADSGYDEAGDAAGDDADGDDGDAD